MTRRDIEEAIRIAQQRTKQIHNQAYVDAWTGLVTVAEAWLKLEAELSDVPVEDRTLARIGRTMRSLLQPTQKTDLQQLREYIQDMSFANKQTLAAITFILNKINQLEREKEKP